MRFDRPARWMVLLGALAAGAATADAGEAGAPGRPQALSLTVSGGVSLGAYEAGFLHGSGAAQASRRSDLRLLTGASAGSLNVLLALLSGCGQGAPAPADSLFWNTWIPTGFGQLHVAGAARPLGVFSRSWLERRAADLEAAWGRGLDPACDVVLGVAVTRVEPRRLRAAQGRLELPRMEEKFAVRIQGRGPGRPPRATNYVAPSSPTRDPLLVTDADGEIPFAALRDLIFASMSFPVAFPPQELRTCAAGMPDAPGVCLPGRAEEASYVDGGVFDNAPLRLAVRLARTGLVPEGQGGALRWRPEPDPEARSTPRDVRFSYLDPAATEYPPPAPPATARPLRASLPREVIEILSAMVETARSKELAVLLEEEPEIADRILLPRRHFPAASAPMLAFLGFFDREFREFDFALGMYDAGRTLAETGLGAGMPAAAPGAPDPALARLACMRAVYDGEPGAAEPCRPAELSDFRALLQVSLDQLYAACAAGPAEQVAAWRNPHCQRAAAGAPPPRVPGLQPRRWPAWRQRSRESELAYTARLLAAYGFRFRDLGVPPGRGDLAVSRIRTALGEAAADLARVQPWADRGTVAFAAKVAADTVAYSPPDRVLHLTMGPTESELGLSRGFFGARWLPPGVRVAGAVGLRGLGQAFSSKDTEPFAVVLAGGLELQPPPGSTALAQLRFGLRAGWLFAADDAWGAGECRDRGGAAVSACSRPVLQALVGFTALERFRLQVAGEWYPGSVKRRTQWSVAPGIGLEVGF